MFHDFKVYLLLTFILENRPLKFENYCQIYDVTNISSLFGQQSRHPQKFNVHFHNIYLICFREIYVHLIKCKI